MNCEVACWNHASTARLVRCSPCRSGRPQARVREVRVRSKFIFRNEKNCVIEDANKQAGYLLPGRHFIVFLDAGWG